MTLDIKLSEDEARSILESHCRAGGVVDRVVDRICNTWPTMRAEYCVVPKGALPGTCWVRSEQVAQKWTHEWVLGVPKPGDDEKLELYAAPEIANVAPGVPFVTALAVDSVLIMLLPPNVPAELRESCGAELEASDMLRRIIDDNTLQGARSVVLGHWQGLMDQDGVWYDEHRAAWVMG